ncbi:MAG: Do family serine endopeptidase AlgW [Gammaproteobacteria bacterium]|nr:MAG: Do family serine endopeptidase AlgW [Gammaproteobacteria bacterium]
MATNMNLRNSVLFLFQTLTVALAAIIVLLFLKPELLQQEVNVVEFREGAAPTRSTSTTVPVTLPIGNGPVSYAMAVEAAAPAVVNIFTARIVTQRVNPILEDPLLRKFFGNNLHPVPRKRLETSLGSGVIMSTQGYVLTNNHVIDAADQIRVQLQDGRDTVARVVGIDPDTDLAVLKIDLDNLPSITLSAPDTLRVGDVVLAIGNPFGVGQTVTMGIISARGRSELGINTFENFIQTDAAINPGNSGGALISAHGELVGINTAIFSKSGGSQGIGFAIPNKLAKGVMQQIIENGRVIRGWLGVEAQNITPELAESFNMEKPAGVLIAGLLRHGPADKAGLQAGDIIIKIGDKPAATAHDVLNAIANTTPGTSVELTILRDGKTGVLSAIVGERPPMLRQRP